MATWYGAEKRPAFRVYIKFSPAYTARSEEISHSTSISLRLLLDLAHRCKNLQKTSWIRKKAEEKRARHSLVPCSRTNTLNHLKLLFFSQLNVKSFLRDFSWRFLTFRARRLKRKINAGMTCRGNAFVWMRDLIFIEFPDSARWCEVGCVPEKGLTSERVPCAIR